MGASTQHVHTQQEAREEVAEDASHTRMKQIHPRYTYQSNYISPLSVCVYTALCERPEAR